MVTRGPRYPKEEFARRADLIYDRDVAPHIKPEDADKIISIDIETGAYEIADTSMEATDRLYARVPDAQPFTMRVGKGPLYRIGGRPSRPVS